MKIKKIISAATCAALITAAALPLTACGGAKSFKKAKDFDLSNYVQELPEQIDMFSRSAVTKVTDLATGFDGYDDDDDTFIPVYKEDNKGNIEITVYNGNTGTKILDKLEDNPVFYNGYVKVRSQVGEGVDAKNVYTLYGENGTKLLENSYDLNINVNTSRYWLGNDVERSTVLTATGVDKDGEDFSTYFSVEYDNYGNVESYKSINKSDIHYVSPDLAAGSDKYASAKLIYSDPEKPVSGDMATYKYATVGNEMVFYNGGAETGRVSTDNMAIKGFVGNYLYYTVLVELPEGSKDANLIMPSSYKELRYSYELHKYDILKNKDSKLNYSYYIYDFTPVYNYKDKTFDAVAVSGSKIVNETVQNNTAFTYVTNAELAVAFDVTQVAQTIDDFGNIYKLEEGKYLVGGEEIAIVNDKLEIISSFSGVIAIPFVKEKVIGIIDYNTYSVCLTDFEGKIIVAPQYTMMGEPAFFGGKVLVRNSLTGDIVTVSADGKETKLPESSSKTTPEGGITSVVVVPDEGCYSVTTSKYTPSDEGDATTTFNVEIFNFDGTSIKTYKSENGVGQEVVSRVGKTMIIANTDSEGETTYTLSVIE